VNALATRFMDDEVEGGDTLNSYELKADWVIVSAPGQALFEPYQDSTVVTISSVDRMFTDWFSLAGVTGVGTETATNQIAWFEPSMSGAAAVNPSEPWLLRRELDGMELQIARVRRIARDLAAAPLQFSEPGLFVFSEEGDDEELVQVSLDLRLMTPDDQVAADFRLAFFKQIEADFHPSILERLSIFMWNG